MKSAHAEKSDWSVISLGGSMIAPKEGIDTTFLAKFCSLIRELLTTGKKFIIVTGGGNVCREYQTAAKKIQQVSNADLDWLGIHATRLNAHLIRTLFQEEAAPRIITDPEEDELPFEKSSIIIAAGWKPGWSTDYVATVLAERVASKQIFNISNVSHVYAADPKKDAKAERFDKLSWKKFTALVGEEWQPGMNAPFDPIAAKKCAEAKIEVDILSGKDIKNIQAALEGKAFEGTRIF